MEKIAKAGMFEDIRLKLDRVPPRHRPAPRQGTRGGPERAGSVCAPADARGTEGVAWVDCAKWSSSAVERSGRWLTRAGHGG